MRWPLGIAACFCVVFGMNAVLVYLATGSQEPVVETYANTQDR